MERLKPIYEKFYKQFPFTGNIVILDTETTGFTKDARVIEIGAIAICYDGFDITFDTFETLINPGFNLDAKIVEITGITDSELENAPSDEKYSHFITWLNQIKPNRIIAHNASFDKRMLEYNLHRTDNQYTFPEWVCTVQLSKRHLKNVKNDKLATLAEYFQFVNQQQHRALSDAETAAYVFCKIMLGEY